MKINHKGMKIVLVEDYDVMSEKVAQIVAAQITLEPDSVLGLATGSTPEKMYGILCDLYASGAVDFSEAVTFNLDEYYDIDESNDQSYACYMNEHLFSKVNINPKNIHIPRGRVEESDLEDYCEVYDQTIADHGKIDLQILGIGENGHIGFNEPDVQFEAGTHLVKLDETTINANARFFDNIDEVPKNAISMGIRNIMQSKKVVLMASGSNKARAVKEMITGAVTPKLPASILQVHPDVTIFLDKEASKEVMGILL